MHQLRVRAGSLNLPVIKHQNLVGMSYGRKPVRNNETGAVFDECVGSPGDELFRFRIEMTGCLVQDQNFPPESLIPRSPTMVL